MPPGQGAQFRVVVVVPAGTSMGSYPFTLRATDGALNYDLPLTLNVGDFTMSLSPAVQQALPTDAANYTLTLTSIDNYQGLVNLTCTGLPAGASCPAVFATNPLPGGSALPFAITTQSVAPGNYPFTITGVSSPLTHNTSATLQVWDFSPTVAPLSATVSPGGSANFTVTVASVNGFDGNVTLWCQNPAAVTCSFNPASGTVPADGKLTSALTLTASAQAGSVAHSRSRDMFWAVVLVLPVGVLFFFRAERRWKSVFFFLFAMGCLLSCGGGGSSGGGGGGGGGTQYPVEVRITSGNTTRTVGTISLTVK